MENKREDDFSALFDAGIDDDIDIPDISDVDDSLPSHDTTSSDDIDISLMESHDDSLPNHDTTSSNDIDISLMESHDDDDIFPDDNDRGKPVIEPEISALALPDEEKDDDIDKILDRQSYENRRSFYTTRKSPSDIILINDASEIADTPPNSDPGDNSTMKKMLALGIVVIALLITIPLIVTFFVPDRDIAEIRSSGPSILGPGDLITQGDGSDNRDRDNDESSAPTTTNDDDVVVPEGGSLVRYEISVEGDISSASTSFINAAGGKDSETGLTEFPWNTSIGMRDSVNPQIAVNTAGYGTVTCTITSGGEKVSEKTSSGENPSVNCTL